MTVFALALALGATACDGKTKRSSRDDTEEEDETPRKKKKAAASSSASALASATTDASAAPSGAATAEVPAGPLVGFTRYTNAAGNYEGLMPCTPVESEVKLATGTPQYRALCDEGARALAFMWQAFPAPGTMANLTGGRDALLKLLENPVVTPIKVDGKYDGFDVSGKHKQLGKTMNVRMFNVHDRFYQAIDSGFPDDVSKAWRESLKVTYGPGASSGAGGTLPKVCEDYIAKLEKCNANAIAGIPEGSAKEDVKKSMADAMKKVRETWSSIGNAAALESACKSASDALAQNPSCK